VQKVGDTKENDSKHRTAQNTWSLSWAVSNLCYPTNIVMIAHNIPCTSTVLKTSHLASDVYSEEARVGSMLQATCPPTQGDK